MNGPLLRRPEGAALGIVVIVATGFTMAFGDALVKAVSSDFSLWQIYVVRSLLAVPLTIALLLSRAPLRGIVPLAPGWAILRSLLLMLMWLAFYAALPVLSLSAVAAAYYTGPLFIALFSALLIGEPVGPQRWAAIVTGFAGVLLIVRPGTGAFSSLALLPVLSAVFYALAAVVTRARCAVENPLVLSLALNLSFLAVGAIGTAAVALWGASVPPNGAVRFLLGPWAPLGSREWAILALMVVLIVAISAGVAKAYQSGPPTIIAIFDYGYLVFAAFWGFIFFAEVPDAWTVAGMLLIAGAGVLVARPSRAATTEQAT
jgi:drug/metabolite transporter (DMT)-like permease